MSDAARWSDDAALFAAVRAHLFTAVVGDILDSCGRYSQFLPPEIKPLDASMVVVGRAMPVLQADWPSRGDARPDAAGHTPPAAQAFGLMFRALDDLKPGEVYVASGGSWSYALWGGLMTTRARYCGAAGAVLHGYTRDTREILDSGFATFSAGTYAQDQGPRGRVVDWRIPIAVGAVVVNPGDVVFGDRDGVVVVPRELEQEVFRRALEKVTTESRVRTAIESGMGTVEAYATYGVM